MKKNTYIFITELLCCAPETNTLLVDYTPILKKKKTKKNLMSIKRKINELLIARTLTSDSLDLTAYVVAHLVLSKACLKFQIFIYGLTSPDLFNAQRPHLSAHITMVREQR